jgi:hypothetical protein
MRPLCVKCQVEYRPEKNDVVVEEIAAFGSYKLWCADLWKCPICHNQIVNGYGRDAYAVYCQDDYPAKLESAKNRGVYQCLEFHEPMTDKEESKLYEVQGLMAEYRTAKGR